MDTRLETIDKLRIATGCEMEAVPIAEMPAENYKAVAQNYLLLKILEQLEDISKSLNLIAVYTGKGYE